MGISNQGLSYSGPHARSHKWAATLSRFRDATVTPTFYNEIINHPGKVWQGNIMNEPSQKHIISPHKVLAEILATGEFRLADFSDSTIANIRRLIRVAHERELTETEHAELEAFRSTAFYMRKRRYL
ncbi:MAG: hypothetical protein BroJett018_33380 [Chloroflexota bacterium]|nr:MAG: hypothetical protein BroJett018_33380 [Chloroflexota bacterium]